MNKTVNGAYKNHYEAKDTRMIWSLLAFSETTSSLMKKLRCWGSVCRQKSKGRFWKFLKDTSWVY